MLDLVWKATFKTGDETQTIGQYDQNKEHLFKEVLDKQDYLINFLLLNRKTEDIYSVDLVNGCIEQYKSGQETLGPRADMLRNGNLKYRLIYFREVERTFNQQLTEIDGPKIIYFVGFQYLDQRGRNHKRIMKIHNDGRCVVN